MKKLLTGLVALSAPAALLVGISSPANAVQHNWTTNYGSGTSEIKYDRELGGKIHMYSSRNGGASTACIDVRTDWDTGGTGHYDARILRNCGVNTALQTDPGGNTWWEEGWSDTSDTGGIDTGFTLRDGTRWIDGMEAAGVFLVDDGTYCVVGQEIWQGASRLNACDADTQNSGNTRVRTIFQGGSTAVTDPYCVLNRQQGSKDTNACAGPGTRVMVNEDLQAAYVTVAWKENGAYSECMAARGYDVPWQDSIGLAPALRDDPELVAEAQERYDNMALERDVPAYAKDHSDAPFNEAVGECRDANPPLLSDAEHDALLTAAPTAKTLRIARRHDWNQTDPFAARVNRR